MDSTGQAIPLDDKAINHLKDTIESFMQVFELCALLIWKWGLVSLLRIKFQTMDILILELWVSKIMFAGVSRSRLQSVDQRCERLLKAIARECGILTDEGIVIEGPEFRETSLEELIDLIPKIQVMARSTPLDKHSLVKHLRTTFNEVVAVTGDGTNDAPTLHDANIGLAMGIVGTEVAQESADVTIMDDNFSNIVTLARWGPSVYVNMQKFIQFQLTVNLVALAVIFSSAWLTGNAPLTAIQLLWVDMIMGTPTALALATEPPKDDLMKGHQLEGKGTLSTMSCGETSWHNLSISLWSYGTSKH